MIREVASESAPSAPAYASELACRFQVVTSAPWAAVFSLTVVVVPSGQIVYVRSAQGPLLTLCCAPALAPIQTSVALSRAFGPSVDRMTLVLATKMPQLPSSLASEFAPRPRASEFAVTDTLRPTAASISTAPPAASVPSTYVW